MEKQVYDADTEKQISDLWDWYQKNKLNLFWYKYRLFMGLDPEGNSTWLKEKLHFAGVRMLRKSALSDNNPHRAFEVVPFIYLQPLLKKWWDKLNSNDREKYLIKTWFEKMDGHLYGLDWWVPYFEDMGFITNCDASKPTKPIVLYRGVEPFFREGMSWTNNIDMAKTFANSASLISNKYVYGTIVEPRSILAVFKGNAVHVDGSPIKNHGIEYVVNHQHLNMDDIFAVDDPLWKQKLEEIEKVQL